MRASLLSGLALLALFATPAHAGDAAKGKTLYTANCMTCHGDSGAGDGPAAIALRPKPTDFTDAGWWTGKTDAGIKTSISAGSPGTPMTGFSQLSDAQLDDLLAHLKTFKP